MPETSRITLIDVANAAGVHFGTASRALDPSKAHLVSDATRAQVAKVAASLGYRANVAARELRKGKSATIGFLVADISNPFFAPILRAAEETLDAAGYSVFVAETRDQPSALATTLTKLLNRGVDGLIVSSARYSDRDFLEATAKEVPIVLAIRDVGSPYLPMVGHDDNLGGKIATNHLLELGHISVAELRGPNEISSFRGRSKGFHAVATRHKMSNLTPRRKYFQPTIEGGIEAARLLLEKNTLPTGLFAHNDLMAIGAIEEFNRNGLNCPADISIVGYNNIPLTDRISPPLTTIELPGGGVGSLAASKLLSLIEKKGHHQTPAPLPPRLIARGSTSKRRH